MVANESYAITERKQQEDEEKMNNTMIMIMIIINVFGTTVSLFIFFIPFISFWMFFLYSHYYAIFRDVVYDDDHVETYRYSKA